MPQRSYVNQRVFAALVALALFSLATTITSVIAISQMVHARQIGVTDSNVRSEVGNLATLINRAESLQRGYILTGDTSYLSQYNDSKTATAAGVARLRAAAQGTVYAADIGQINSLITERTAIMDEAISIDQSQGQAAAIADISASNGHQIIETLQSKIAAVQKRVNADVAVTRLAIDKYASLARVVGILTLLGTLTLVVVIYTWFNHAIASERALDRAKDEFVSLASHQLRTPATGIKSILSMLDQGDFGELSEVQHRVVGKAIKSNEREIRIIEELLNVAKADAGRLVLKPTKVNISALVESIVGEQRPVIAAKSLTLKLDLPDKPVHLVADEEKLYMAISNLVDNARKYTPEDGKITVTLLGRRGHVIIEIADSGIGIEADEIGNIFDRFQRARMVLSGNIEGTGLGLYLARRIAELHHGTINVDSKKGHGSRFTLVLPNRITA